MIRLAAWGHTARPTTTVAEELRRGEALGLRWDHIDLTGAQAKQRKLPDGTPSVAVVNNRVITLAADDIELIIEGAPKGKGRRRRRTRRTPRPTSRPG